MNVHLLGIGGTFMGGLALLARDLGHQVSGSDQGVYPPMSTLLDEQGIVYHQGYDENCLQPHPELVIVGNAMKRGIAAVEYLLAHRLPYISGPQWLGEQVLRQRKVIAVAGTHGKTTTTAMVAWILEYARLQPGFLIGGVAHNFTRPTRLGAGQWFVIEADEYDTAFFDKRSKFVHYHPTTVILNNLEYDHADIFPDIAAIQRQFHHLLRLVPANGLVLVHHGDANLAQVLAMGCWSPVQHFGAQGQWQVRLLAKDGAHFAVRAVSQAGAQEEGEVRWNLIGEYNCHNAVAALAAARFAGVDLATGCAALHEFQGVKRRLEIRGQVGGVTVYDDFAHHPTAIALTLAALRHKVGTARIIAVLEPRSNTMRLGVHQATLEAALEAADHALIYLGSELTWNLTPRRSSVECQNTLPALVERLQALARPGDHIVIMSNGSFGRVHEQLLQALA